jgi:hypothetical protein
MQRGGPTAVAVTAYEMPAFASQISSCQIAHATAAIV